MPKNSSNDIERHRIKTLSEMQILDTAPERMFDEVAYRAATICGAPIAAISLIDTHRQWFKASIGLKVRETPREFAFCDHAIRSSSEIFIVEDATRDERFHSNPLVLGEPHIRFYAGASIAVDPGVPLGTLCVIDTKPRPLRAIQAQALQKLRDKVVTEFKSRRDKMLSRNTMQEQICMTGSDNDEHIADILSQFRQLEHAKYKYSKWLHQKVGITLSQLLVLEVLAKVGDQNQTDLAEELCQSSSTMVGIIDRLHSAGLVTRRRDKRDRRNSVVGITQSGYDVLNNDNVVGMNPIIKGVKSLNRNSQKALATSLSSIVSAASEF